MEFFLCFFNCAFECLNLSSNDLRHLWFCFALRDDFFDLFVYRIVVKECMQFTFIIHCNPYELYIVDEKDEPCDDS